MGVTIYFDHTVHKWIDASRCTAYREQNFHLFSQNIIKSWKIEKKTSIVSPKIIIIPKTNAFSGLLIYLLDFGFNFLTLQICCNHVVRSRMTNPWWRLTNQRAFLHHPRFSSFSHFDNLEINEERELLIFGLFFFGPWVFLICATLLTTRIITWNYFFLVSDRLRSSASRTF